MKCENFVKNQDPELFKHVTSEFKRQTLGLEMIASENYASPAVMEAQGSIFTNKYAEGYPGKRYYGGCEFIDKVEDIAIQRAKNFLKLSMQMFNHTLAHKQTWPSSWLA